MTYGLYTNIISPHQIPLAQEIVTKVGQGNYRYVFAEQMHKERDSLGWRETIENWALNVAGEDAQKWLSECDVLLTGFRDWNLIERRNSQKKKTFYFSERWFKPRMGILRLLCPTYFSMAKKFVQILKNNSDVCYLAMGIHAARDMARLCGLLSGDFRCLFRAPQLEFDRKPGGRIWMKTGDGDDAKKYCLDKMRMWGYYVEPSKVVALPDQEASNPRLHEIKALWVGRLLNWKCVDTILRAVSEHANLKRVDDSLPKITLDIYGSGPEEDRLREMAREYYDLIHFHPSVPISEVRHIMRGHDVYVLASNGYEGWGAVVNEALEEGCRVIGTFDAGSSATILSAECLFNAGDWRKLRELLMNAAKGKLWRCGIGEWTAKKAADYLCAKELDE